MLILRQAKGETMTPYESYFVLSFVMAGLIVTRGSLLPSVLALSSLPAGTMWRLSSAITAIPILLFIMSLPRRRHAATRSPMPRFVGSRWSNCGARIGDGRCWSS